MLPADATRTKTIAFSIHDVDEVLGDLGADIPARTRAAHGLNPVDPSAYLRITPMVLGGQPDVGAALLSRS